jgi:hypothetical protein
MRIPPDLSREFTGDAHLYRALRPEEVEAGCVLIPKGQGPFARRSRREKDAAQETVQERAVLQREWRRRGCPSRGVSTTPHLDRARRYADAGGVVVELDRTLFERNWIREYPVKELLGGFPEGIAAPDDDEVILVCELEGPFPEEIVKRILYTDGARRAALPALLASGDTEPWNAYARGQSLRAAQHGER